MEVTEMSEDNVLDVEAGEVKGEDQGNSVLVASGERERKRAELKKLSLLFRNFLQCW